MTHNIVFMINKHNKDFGDDTEIMSRKWSELGKTHSREINASMIPELKKLVSSQSPKNGYIEILNFCAGNSITPEINKELHTDSKGDNYLYEKIKYKFAKACADNIIERFTKVINPLNT